MRESLGEKIGEVVSADIHAWAPGAWTYLGAFDFKKRTHAPQYQPVVLQIEFAGMDRSSLQSSSALRFATGHFDVLRSTLTVAMSRSISP